MVKRRVRLSKYEKQRQTIETVINRDIKDDLEGGVKGIIECLQSILDEKGGKFNAGIYIYFETVCEYGDECIIATLTGYSKETDSQYEKRIEKLKKDKKKIIDKNEKVERKMYKELKKKFGN